MKLVTFKNLVFVAHSLHLFSSPRLVLSFYYIYHLFIITIFYLYFFIYLIFLFYLFIYLFIFLLPMLKEFCSDSHNYNIRLYFL